MGTETGAQELELGNRKGNGDWDGSGTWTGQQLGLGQDRNWGLGLG
jgi:hypothetical protein